MSEKVIYVGLTLDPENLKEIQGKRITEIHFGEFRWGVFETKEKHGCDGYTKEEDLIEEMRCMINTQGFKLFYSDEPYDQDEGEPHDDEENGESDE